MNNLITTVKYFKLDNQQDKCFAGSFLNMDVYMFRVVPTDTFLICQEPSIPKTKYTICSGQNPMDMIIAIVEKNKNPKSVLKSYIQYIEGKELYVESDMNSISPILLIQHTIDYLDVFCENNITPHISKLFERRQRVLDYLSDYEKKLKELEVKKSSGSEKLKGVDELYRNLASTTGSINYVDYGRWLSEQSYEVARDEMVKRMSNSSFSSNYITLDNDYTPTLASIDKKETTSTSTTKKDSNLIDKIKKVFSKNPFDDSEDEGPF